jgi:hypothetical protein
MDIKNFIKKVIPNKIKRVVNQEILEHANLCYSQEGEDLILFRIFENKPSGFYVDIGAHHPKRFSNTMYFYKLGWNGINIDAMPGSMDAFNLIRPRDINLEIPVSDIDETRLFYIFNEPALNTFSEERANEYCTNSNYFIAHKKTLKTRTLESILDQYLPKNQTIDFLTIDVEGYDINVLKSNNWGKYNPKIVLVEISGSFLENICKDEVTIYMRKLDYILYAKTCNTIFFMKNQSQSQFSF